MDGPGVGRTRHRVRVPELGLQQKTAGGLEAAAARAGLGRGRAAADRRVRRAGFHAGVRAIEELRCTQRKQAKGSNRERHREGIATTGMKSTLTS